jgi:hypothetical protein
MSILLRGRGPAARDLPPCGIAHEGLLESDAHRADRKSARRQGKELRPKQGRRVETVKTERIH